MKARVLGRKAGFTLVELLAVITIIILLSGGLVVSVGYFTKRATQSRTTSIVMLAAQGIQAFHDEFHVYPPEFRDSANAVFFREEGAPNNPFSRGGWEPEYDFDVSDSNYNYASEILYYFLYQRIDEETDPDVLEILPRKSVYVEFPEYAVKDVDEDGRNEIVDAWGNPLLYVAKDLYPELGETQATDGNVEPHEAKNGMTFSLYSYGNDALGMYDATQGGEVHYPVQHKSLSRIDMLRAISNRYGTGQVGFDKANKDNISNWQE
jgi:prepilin-type N-terminal cleavage/methylation domain-containing protein